MNQDLQKIGRSFNECPSCGAKNDMMFTNCIYCNTPLPQIEMDNDELVSNASEWIGRLSGSNQSDIRIQIEYASGQNINMGKTKFKVLSFAEVVGYAEKYLNLLELRSYENLQLKNLTERLKHRFDRNLDGAKKKHKNELLFVMLMLLIVFIPYFFIIRNIDSESDNKIENDRYLKLDVIEQKIEDSIVEKNYDRALTQVERLYWSWDLNTESGKDAAKQYDLKRENYRKTISELMKDEQLKLSDEKP